MDNVIIAFGSFHWLQKGMSRNEKYMAMKLDISNGYDRVESDFFSFKLMLRKLCFTSHFCSLIMNCV